MATQLSQAYLGFWIGVGLFVMFWTWVLCSFTVIGGMRRKSLGRVLLALLLGPLLIRNRGWQT